jgi:hypothetical protein
MASYPIEIRRCRHVKTNGTQCGSPALKAQELCFYHDRNRPEPVELYLDGERYCDSQIVLPVFEDAHSIQTVIRQVVQLMLTRRIARKDAGLLLYALQIASGNLKMMQAEKAKPTQVVVEPEKAAETPLGMTPWSATGQGHDPDEADDKNGDGNQAEPGQAAAEQAEAQSSPAPPPSPEELYAALTLEERRALRKKFDKQGLFPPQEFENYFMQHGPDPLLLAITRLHAEKPGSQDSSNCGAGAPARDKPASEDSSALVPGA